MRRWSTLAADRSRPLAQWRKRQSAHQDCTSSLAPPTTAPRTVYVFGPQFDTLRRHFGLEDGVPVVVGSLVAAVRLHIDLELPVFD